MTTRQIEQDAENVTASARRASEAAQATSEATLDATRGTAQLAVRILSDAAHAALGAADLGVARLQGRSDANFVPHGGGWRSRLSEGFDRLSTRGRRMTGRARRGVHDQVDELHDEAEELEARTERAARSARRRGETAVETGRTPTAETESTIASEDDLHHPGLLYERRTVAELQELATERNIEGRSSMAKAELIEALRQ